MNENKHNRHSVRLKGYDYSQSGYYFITVCTQNRECIFGNIVGVGRDRPETIGRDRPEMVLNKMGEIIQSVWESLPQHHPVILNEFQIMPNHVHMIIIMGASRRAKGGSRPAPTLGNIVGLFKSEITKQIRIIMDNPQFPVWQRNFYEHVIRGESELNKIREYIKTNPEMWPARQRLSVAMAGGDRDRNNPEFKNYRMKSGARTAPLH